MKRRICGVIIKAAAICAIALLACLNYSDGMRTIRALPDTIYVSDTRRLPKSFPQQSISPAVRVDAQQAERLSELTDAAYTFRLFGLIPLRTVAVVHTDDTYLIPGGHAVGITLHTAGVLVVGLGTVEGEDGVQSPAAASGLAAGDVVVSADGTPVRNAKHLASICADCGGTLSLVVARGGESHALTVHPARDRESGDYRIGAWVRDSTAGVGTLSFCSQSDGTFAALGHAVSDIDTQSMLTVGEGKLLSAEIVDVIRGSQGEPGELLGVFSADGQAIGSIQKNTEFGIFGVLEKTAIVSETEAVPMAYAYEAHPGPATLLATVSGSTVAAFDCEITRVNVQQGPAAKGMIVTVTDDRLLSATGGIVQGMVVSYNRDNTGNALN